MKKKWVQIACEVPEAMVDDLSEFLVELSPDGIITENLTLDTFSLESLEEAPTKTVIAFFEADDGLTEKITSVCSFLKDQGPRFSGFCFVTPKVEYIKEEDWSNCWKAHFKPSRIGNRLIVKPTWEEFPAAGEDIVLELDPGMAFGTGTHPTTKLCLEVLEKIFFREGIYRGLTANTDSCMLDVGTGSGILSIAAAKFGARQVIAVDIDPQAVEVAAENIRLNKAEKTVTVSDTALVGIEGKYDIVVANILAEDLVRMAPELVKRVRQGGFLILSGILIEKEDIVRNGFSVPELNLIDTSREAEWSCLTFCRKN